MKKKCFRCGSVLDLSEFYKHNQMYDGHLNKCKQCTKEDSINNRNKNIERVRDYDRNRVNKKERTEKNKKRVMLLKTDNPEKYKKQVVETKSNYRKRNSIKRIAHEKIEIEINSGRLANPNICSKCLKSIKTEAHHPNYENPLDIIWLCDKCHKDEHNLIRELQRNNA